MSEIGYTNLSPSEREAIDKFLADLPETTPTPWSRQLAMQMRATRASCRDIGFATNIKPSRVMELMSGHPYKPEPAEIEAIAKFFRERAKDALANNRKL